jgi:hypothetical protein
VVDNYLRSGVRFVYLHLALDKRKEPRQPDDVDPTQEKDQ